jgi:hypothetical protein
MLAVVMHFARSFPAMGGFVDITLAVLHACMQTLGMKSMPKWILMPESLFRKMYVPLFIMAAVGL